MHTHVELVFRNLHLLLPLPLLLLLLLLLQVCNVAGALAAALQPVHHPS
jgi:hypothetical protein